MDTICFACEGTGLSGEFEDSSACSVCEGDGTLIASWWAEWIDLGGEGGED